jgi:hypothetical protein
MLDLFSIVALKAVFLSPLRTSDVFFAGVAGQVLRRHYRAADGTVACFLV